MTDDTALIPAQPQALIGTTPDEVVVQATAIANSLTKILKAAPTVTIAISGRNYVRVEGWTTMLAMMKVTPRVEWTRRVTDDQLTYPADYKEGDAPPVAWEARVVLVHMLTGKEVGAAEAMASNAERIRYKNGGSGAPPWAGSDYAIRSMAQTRAVGKAARLGFSWIMVLSGYEPTPAEEMPDEEGGAAQKAAGRQRKAAPPPRHQSDLDIARAQCAAVVEQLAAMCKDTIERGDSWSGPLVPEQARTNQFAAEALRHLLLGDGPWDRNKAEDMRLFYDALCKLREQNTPPGDTTDLGPA